MSFLVTARPHPLLPSYAVSTQGTIAPEASRSGEGRGMRQTEQLRFLLTRQERCHILMASRHALPGGGTAQQS